MNNKDYYEILGIEKSATNSEIKNKFKELAKQWHPDVNQSPDALEKYKDLQKAYETLSDFEKKRQYDTQNQFNIVNTEKRETLAYKLKPLIVIVFYILFDLFYAIPFQILHIDPEHLSTLAKTIYLIAANIIFIGVIIYIYKDDFYKQYKDFQLNGRGYIKKGLNYWIYGLIIMIVINNIIAYFAPSSLPANEKAVRGLVEVMPFYMVFATIFYAPIAEETIFRKIFKDLIKNKWIFIIISALAFGAAHIVGTVSSPIDWLYIIPYGSLGFVFAYAYYKTDNIFTSILLHAIHNSCLMLLYLFIL